MITLWGGGDKRIFVKILCVKKSVTRFSAVPLVDYYGDAAGI